jgi:5-methylcytosine-specific restriction enzyme subunit McrC
VASRADLERLSEGQVLDTVDLTLAEASALNTTGLVSVQPSVSGWRVTAAHAVGAVRCGDLRVRVHPKVGSVQVLRLLARAHGVRGIKINESLIGVESDPDLTAVLAVLFAEEAATTLAIGPLRGYRRENQSGNVLRGRLRMRDQELRRFGLPLPLATLGCEGIDS